MYQCGFQLLAKKINCGCNPSNRMQYSARFREYSVRKGMVRSISHFRQIVRVFRKLQYGYTPFLKFSVGQHHYTPGIYADGYIVFVFPFVRSSVCMFVCSFVRNSVTFIEFASKFCVKVSQVVYISATTYQKAFIFGP